MSSCSFDFWQFLLRYVLLQYDYRWHFDCGNLLGMFYILLTVFRRLPLAVINGRDTTPCLRQVTGGWVSCALHLPNSVPKAPNYQVTRDARHVSCCTPSKCQSCVVCFIACVALLLLNIKAHDVCTTNRMGQGELRDADAWHIKRKQIVTAAGNLGNTRPYLCSRDQWYDYRCRCHHRALRCCVAFVQVPSPTTRLAHAGSRTQTLI